jgi:hypothetical protein
MQRLSTPQSRQAIPVFPGKGPIERSARPEPKRRTGCDRSTRSAPVGLRHAQPTRAPTQQPQPSVVFWSFCQRCNRAFAQQRFSDDKGAPETLCSERCGREPTLDADAQRPRGGL